MSETDVKPNVLHKAGCIHCRRSCHFIRHIRCTTSSKRENGTKTTQSLNRDPNQTLLGHYAERKPLQMQPT